MDCPYCAEEIKDGAVVCKHCHRDFFAVRPLLDKLDQLTKRLDTLETASEAAAARLAAVPTASATATDATAAGAASQNAPAVRSKLPTMSRSAALAYTFIALVLAHFVIVVTYDLSLIFLRIVSILVPMTFGFLYQERPKHHLPIAFAASIVLAVVSILTMSAIVGKLDKVPILPHDAAGWREFAEYSASIAFGFFTGVLVRQSLLLAFSPGLKSNPLVRMATEFVQAKLGISKGKKDIDTARIEAMISTAVSVGTAVISVVTGLRQFLG